MTLIIDSVLCNPTVYHVIVGTDIPLIYWDKGQIPIWAVHLHSCLILEPILCTAQEVGGALIGEDGLVVMDGVD